jgi:hypothetical protein
MRAFRAETREYCAYADWAENGARARFFGHIDTCGDDLIRKARALVAREIADGHGADPGKAPSRSGAFSMPPSRE